MLPPEAPFPVTSDEYNLGFARAIVIAAADDASERHREPWPENLRSMQGVQWYTASCIPNVETARKRGMTSLAKMAEGLCTGTPTSARAKTWEQFVDFVALALNPKA